MKKNLKYIIFSIIVILIITIIVVLNIVRKQNKNNEEYSTTKIVTSFYPMYILTENLTQKAENIELVNMADVNVGCLHDYTLVTEDIKKVEKADIFISNGLGMENFIEKLISSNKDMNVIDSSKNISDLIKSEEIINPHIWTSIDNYINQVETVCDELKKYNPENAKTYEKNAKTYIGELKKLKDSYTKNLAALNGKKAICLNEAFEYMGKELGLELINVKTNHEESTMSAEMLKSIVDQMKEQNIEIILVDKNDNKSNAETIANETGAKIYELNSGLTGNLDKDAYINCMKENIEILKNIK